MLAPRCYIQRRVVSQILPSQDHIIFKQRERTKDVDSLNKHAKVGKIKQLTWRGEEFCTAGRGSWRGTSGTSRCRQQGVIKALPQGFRVMW